MQFRGYSLPVHHCSGTMGPLPCPISYALFRPRDLFRLLAIGMCHFLPVYHLGIAFLGWVEGQNITIPQPPYSPDFASCDCWLFPKLRGCRYETIEKMKEAVTKVIDMLRQDDFHGALQKLLER